MIDDAELLRSYAESRSQAAFTALVQRHANLVYSVALRQVGGDVHLAQDVMQKVFADLARKAADLSQRAVIAGWLCRGAKFAASDLVRVERRRRRREEETETMRDNPEDAPLHEAGLEGARPILDEVMAKLSETDRDAVALRFFENRSFPEIGRTLRLNEEAARKRVERALEKMRTLLLRRGIPSSMAVLTTALSGQAATIAPTQLVATVASSVLAAGGAGAGAGGAAITFMNLTKIQIAITVGMVAATAGAISLYNQSEPPAQNPPVSSEIAENNLATTTQLPISAGPAITNATAPVAFTIAASSPRKTSTGSEASDATQRAAQDRRLIVRRYSALFTKLGLSDEQRGKLIQILTEDREASVDFAAASAVSDLDASQDPASFNDSVHEMRANLAGSVNALLGDELYAQFVTGNEAIRKDAVIQRTQKDLKDMGARMSTAQAEKLRQTLEDLNVHYIDDEVLLRASTFLSPAQMDVLKVQYVRRTHGESKEKVQKAIKQNLR